MARLHRNAVEEVPVSYAAPFLKGVLAVALVLSAAWVAHRMWPDSDGRKKDAEGKASPGAAGVSDTDRRALVERPLDALAEEKE